MVPIIEFCKEISLAKHLKCTVIVDFVEGNLATPKFKLAFIVLLIATLIWGIAIAHYVLQEYGVLYVLSVDLFLFYAWGVFIWQILLNLKLSELKKTRREISKLIYRFVFGLRRLTYASVLGYFKTANQKARVKLAFWRMKHETRNHVDLLIKVFKWVVLPASLLYVCTDLYLFGENTLDSMFLGILIFVYSSFLPDLPSIFRKKPQSYVKDKTEDLPWYKKYALLLFAPLYIFAFLGLGMRRKWKTTETFHNFKSLIIYDVFLFVLSLLIFGAFPISIGDITEILSVPLYGLVGFLTHLKVDKVW